MPPSPERAHLLARQQLLKEQLMLEKDRKEQDRKEHSYRAKHPELN